MKALTIIQPWASLIAEGKKRIETRSWSTAYRGPLAIHASSKKLPWKTIESLSFEFPEGSSREVGRLPFGAVIATCELVAVEPIGPGVDGWGWTGPDGTEYNFELTEKERGYGDFTPRRYAWLLHNVKPIEPVVCKGRLGLWEYNGGDYAKT